MLQRQKGPEWWYGVKKMFRGLFEHKRPKVLFILWVVIIGFNVLSSSLSGQLNKPYTSEEKFLGIPLLTTEPFRFAIVSLGGISCGIISVGGLSLGLFSIGGISLGWLVLAGLAGGYFSVGGLALGYYTIGGLAIGGDAYAGGGIALGLYEAEGEQKE